MSDLVERLRKMAATHERGFPVTILYSEISQALDIEAADRITALEKENERFRGALTAIAEAWDETDEWDGTNKFNASRDIARTALRDGGGE